ncbi:MAG: hypothetical protein H6624_16700 [Bdellovibrionaceae bacterium]|nr:hypothetical protein [Bdellovibrionales bacterium]MCB9085986.1 hypothetical protein [Pseudobdellovibrionaceae bacterium]
MESIGFCIRLRIREVTQLLVCLAFLLPVPRAQGDDLIRAAVKDRIEKNQEVETEVDLTLKKGEKASPIAPQALDGYEGKVQQPFEPDPVERVKIAREEAAKRRKEDLLEARKEAAKKKAEMLAKKREAAKNRVAKGSKGKGKRLPAGQLKRGKKPPKRKVAPRKKAPAKGKATAKKRPAKAKKTKRKPAKK